jgi:hypothetical protein
MHAGKLVGGHHLDARDALAGAVASRGQAKEAT